MVICNHCHKSFRKGNGRGSLKTHCAAIKAARNRKPGKTPKQKLLEPKDIRKLCHIIASLFKHRRKLVKEYPLAKLITRPRVPNTLSEPIVIHLLNQGKILPELSKFSFKLGGIADITASYKSTAKKIEVKSTGVNEFQQLTNKDVKSDYLIWLNFADAFIRNNFSGIKIIIVKKPKQYPKLVRRINKQPKITLKVFREKLGRSYKEKTINLNKL